MTNSIKSKDEKISIIKTVVGDVFKNSINGLRVNNTLVLTVYNTLYQLYVEDCDNVTISAPTGSGKSIISYLLSFCCEKINEKLELEKDEDLTEENINSNKFYILTSSIMLQEQISEDIERFEMNNIAILKGANNYPCTNKTKMDETPNVSVPWSNRACIGVKKQKISEKFECFSTCGYYNQLNKCSNANVSVLNYAYFLKAVPNSYFGKGFLTICDEAHLTPDIISNTFSVDIKKEDWSFVDDLILNFMPGEPLTNNEMLEFKFLSKIFNKNLNKNNVNDLRNWCFNFTKWLEIVVDICDTYKEGTLKMFPILSKKIEKVKRLFSTYKTNIFIIGRIKPEDLFITSNENQDYGYSFNVRDLNEKNIISDVLGSLTHKTVFLSATYGNINTFNNFFSFEKFKNYRLPSTFDFSKSPIVLKESGWLNYSNFDNNIDKVIVDTLKVVNQHKNENGIIHTGTFKIANLLKDYIQKLPPIFKSRFLFYSNSDEKNQIISRLNNATKLGKFGYILVGPSLYEGLDLKDDLGRFNIIIKAPYGALDDYTKEKMKRFPDWYKNLCLQKIEQAIGRTNRHKDDQSTVYLMDSSLKKLVLQLDSTIKDRLIYG